MVICKGEGREEQCAVKHSDCLFNMRVSLVERGSQTIVVSAGYILGGLSYFF